MIRQEQGTRGDSVPDVSSIISEIDDIVDGIETGQGSQVVRSRSHSMPDASSDDPARKRPNESVSVGTDDSEGAFDIEQLERELDVAIDAELGHADGNGFAATEGAIPETYDRESPKTEDGSRAGSSDQDVMDGPSGDGGGLEKFPGEEVDPGGGFVDLLLKPVTAPVDALSPNSRVLLNILAVSTALWVPVVWMVVRNG